MGLQRFERRLEKLVEGTFTRTLRIGLQPVEIGKRIAREMDLRRTVGPRSVIAPNAFEVCVSQKDMTRFTSYREALVHELKETVREHADDEGYTLLGPVEIYLEEDPKLKVGVFTLAAEVHEQEGEPWVGSILFPDGTEVELQGALATIGRLATCDVVVNDPSVSRRHAELRFIDDSLVLFDLGSTNGTRVNGMNVSQRRLIDGDKISVGNTTLQYRSN